MTDYQTCSECLRYVGNRMTITVHGKTYCGRVCGIRGLGVVRYEEAWNELALEILRRDNKHQKGFTVLEGRKKEA